DIIQFFDQISTGEQKNLEFSFAEAIYQCGRPIELEPIVKLFKK
ncbi:27818_t:CDS:1, partial [Dentiscutata erythropus]